MRTVTFALLLAFIFFIPWEGVVELSSLGTGAKLIGFAASAFWLATIINTGRLRKPRPFHVLVCIFVLWNAVSVFWSANPNRTIDQVITWMQLFILILIMWDLLTTRTHLLVAMQAFVLGEFVGIGSAVYNFFSGDVYYTHYQRFSPAEQSNPDGFGFIVALGIPVAWYLASSKSSLQMIRWLRLVNYIYIPAAFIGISLSGTRTALIATIPAMAFGLASLTRLRLWARVAIFLFVTLITLFLLPYAQSLRSFERFGTTATDLAEGNLNQRTLIWREGLDSFAEHPLLGVGSNMYRSVNTLGKLAHNSFLSVLVELGLVGFALFGIILAIVIIQAGSQSRWDAVFWFTVLAVWIIGASTLTYEYRKATWLFMSLIIASAALTSHRDETVSLVERDRGIGRFVQHPKLDGLPQGE